MIGADQLIAGLKAENERLKADIAQLTSSRRESSVSNASTTSTTSSDQLAVLSRQLDLYRELSGLEIVDVVGQFSWKCVLNGRLGQLTFDLSFNEESESFEYVPQIHSALPLRDLLPAYLLEEITFGPDQLQLFFWRAMNFLMSSSGMNGE